MQSPLSFLRKLKRSARPFIDGFFRRFSETHKQFHYFEGKLPFMMWYVTRLYRLPSRLSSLLLLQVYFGTIYHLLRLSTVLVPDDYREVPLYSIGYITIREKWRVKIYPWIVSRVPVLGFVTSFVIWWIHQWLESESLLTRTALPDFYQFSTQFRYNTLFRARAIARVRDAVTLRKVFFRVVYRVRAVQQARKWSVRRRRRNWLRRTWRLNSRLTRHVHDKWVKSHDGLRMTTKLSRRIYRPTRRRTAHAVPVPVPAPRRRRRRWTVFFNRNYQIVFPSRQAKTASRLTPVTELPRELVDYEWLSLDNVFPVDTEEPFVETIFSYFDDQQDDGVDFDTEYGHLDEVYGTNGYVDLEELQEGRWPHDRRNALNILNFKNGARSTFPYYTAYNWYDPPPSEWGPSNNVVSFNPTHLQNRPTTVEDESFFGMGDGPSVVDSEDEAWWSNSDWHEVADWYFFAVQKRSKRSDQRQPDSMGSKFLLFSKTFFAPGLLHDPQVHVEQNQISWWLHNWAPRDWRIWNNAKYVKADISLYIEHVSFREKLELHKWSGIKWFPAPGLSDRWQILRLHFQKLTRRLIKSDPKRSGVDSRFIVQHLDHLHKEGFRVQLSPYQLRRYTFYRRKVPWSKIVQGEYNDDVRRELNQKNSWPKWHAPRYQPVYLRNQQTTHLHQKESSLSFGSSSMASPGFGVVGLTAVGLIAFELLVSSWGWADSAGPAYSIPTFPAPWTDWWHTVVVHPPTHPHFLTTHSVNTLFPWIAEAVSTVWSFAATIDTTLDTWEYLIGYLVYLDTPIYLFQWIWLYQFPSTVEHLVRDVWSAATQPIDTIFFTAELVAGALLRTGYYVVSHFNGSIGSFNVGPIWSPTMTSPVFTFRIDWINHFVVAWNSFIAWCGSTDGSLFFPKVTTRRWHLQWTNPGGMYPLWFDWTPLVDRPVAVNRPRVDVTGATELFRRLDFQKDGQVRRFFDFEGQADVEDLNRLRTWSRAPGIGSNLFINNHVDNVFGQFELHNFKIGFADDDLILNLKMFRRMSEVDHVFRWDVYQPPWSPSWAEFHYKIQDSNYGTAWLRRVRLGEAPWYNRQINFHWLKWEYFLEYDFDRQVILWLKHRICGVMIGRSAATESQSWMQSASASAVFVDPRMVFSDRQNFHINWLSLWGRICVAYNFPDDELIAAYRRHTLGHIDVTWALPRRFEDTVDEFWLMNLPQLWETQIASTTLSTWRNEAEQVIRDRTVAYAPGDWLLSYVDDFGRRLTNGINAAIDQVTSSRITWWLVVPYGCSRLRSVWVAECSRELSDFVVRTRPVRRRLTTATVPHVDSVADAVDVGVHDQTDKLYRTGTSFTTPVDPSDSFNLTHQHNRENHQLRVHHTGGPAWKTADRAVRGTRTSPCGRGDQPVSRRGWSRGVPAIHGNYSSWRPTTTGSSSWLTRPIWSAVSTYTTEHDVRRGERDLEDTTLDADPERETTGYWYNEIGLAPRWLHSELPIGWYARRQSTRELEYTRDVIRPATGWRSATYVAGRSAQSEYHRNRYRTTVRVITNAADMCPTVKEMYQVLNRVNYPGCCHVDDDEITNGCETDWYDDDEDVNILGYSGRESDENAEEHSELDSVDEQYDELVYVGFEPDQLVGVSHAELTDESEIARLLSAHRTGSLPSRTYRVSAPAEMYTWMDHPATSLQWSATVVDHPVFAGLSSVSYEVARYLRRCNHVNDEIVRTAPTGLHRDGSPWSSRWQEIHDEVHHRRGGYIAETAVSATSLTAAARHDSVDWYHATTSVSVGDVDGDTAWWDETVTTPGQARGGYIRSGVPGVIDRRFRPWTINHDRVWCHTGINGARELTGEDLRVVTPAEPEIVWLGQMSWWESHDWWEWLLETDELRDEYYDHPDDDNEDGDDGDVEVNPSRPADFPDWIVDLALAGTSPGDRRGSAVRARFGTTNLSEPHDEIEVFRSKPFTMYLFSIRDDPPEEPEWTFTRPKGERSDRVDRYRWRALTKSELTRFDGTETKDLAEDYSLRQTKVKIWALTEVYYNDGPHGRIKWS